MTNKLLAIGLLFAAPAFAPAQAPPPVRQQVVLTGELGSVVRVRDEMVSGDEISGTLVNLTDDELREIRIRVRDTFLWRNERRPGEDNFSRAEEFVVRGPIPPRGALAFTAPHSLLPARSDGDFRTSVEVTSLTRQPMTARAPSPVTPPPAAAAPPPPVGTEPPAGTVREYAPAPAPAVREYAPPAAVRDPYAP